MILYRDLQEASIEALSAIDPSKKCELADTIARELLAGRLTRAFRAHQMNPPDRPGRPDKPVLLAPRDMPKRKAGGDPKKRAAMLHALAHIELNAIDLALDMIARFDAPDLPDAFALDWARVAAEEALHFQLLCERLAQLGHVYGDFPAHDGLWEAASETARDVLSRLAVVPLVLEARGLDVTPSTIAAFSAHGDKASCAVLERIYEDEIAHVATGMRWFRQITLSRGHDPRREWQRLVAAHFRGQLKPPFNRAARDRAGMPAEFYLSA